MTEDWPILLSFFPDDWVELASSTNALKGLRKDKAAENYMRTLLMHIGCGYSLRETVTRAKLSNLADISDVALVKRLRKAKDWFHSLCVKLFEEQGIKITKVYHCPHHPEITGECDCRKPKPGMILQAIERFKIDPVKSVLIGDKKRDILAGQRAGIGKNLYIQNLLVRGIF